MVDAAAGSLTLPKTPLPSHAEIWHSLARPDPLTQCPPADKKKRQVHRDEPELPAMASALCPKGCVWADADNQSMDAHQILFVLGVNEPPLIHCGLFNLNRRPKKGYQNTPTNDTEYVENTPTSRACESNAYFVRVKFWIAFKT